MDAAVGTGVVSDLVLDNDRARVEELTLFPRLRLEALACSCGRLPDWTDDVAAPVATPAKLDADLGPTVTDFLLTPVLLGFLLLIPFPILSLDFESVRLLPAPTPAPFLLVTVLDIVIVIVLLLLFDVLDVLHACSAVDVISETVVCSSDAG